MTQEKINRINELARKSKTVGLTEAEKSEQTALRNEYREAIKKSLIGALNSTYVVNKDGSKTKLKYKK